MNNKEQKEQIQQAKVAQKIAKYSADYDMSVVIKCVFAIFGGLILGLLILEGVGVFVFDKEPGVYLAAGLILALFAYVAGWASAIVTYFFMKKAKEEAKEEAKPQ